MAERLVEDLSARHPTLLVVSGDFTQRARRAQFAAAAAYLARLPTPRLVVPGNHDVPLYDVARRFFHPLDRYRRLISDDLAPRFQDDRLLVMGLNTARSLTWTGGRIAASQLDTLQAQVNAAAPDLFKVVVTHHPFIPSPRDPEGDIVQGAERALARLETLGVDMLLAGHLHRAYHDDVRSSHKTIRRSILSIQAGTATSTRRRGEPNAYNWITISPELVTVTVRAWNGQQFEDSLVTRYTRLNEVWQREGQVAVDAAAQDAVGAAAVRHG